MLAVYEQTLASNVSRYIYIYIYIHIYMRNKQFFVFGFTRQFCPGIVLHRQVSMDKSVCSAMSVITSDELCIVMSQM